MKLQYKQDSYLKEVVLHHHDFFEIFSFSPAIYPRQIGTSIHRISKKRLMIARQLLSQGERPSNVYSACGFGDYIGFYRAFKSEYGCSPRAYTLTVRQRSQQIE